MPPYIKKTKLVWNFSPTGGGAAQGFNDPAVEHFRANVIEHVVREVIQNSLDAKGKRHGPIIVKIEKIELSKEAFNAKKLKPHFQASLDKLKKENNKKGISFYENAMNFFNHPKIPVLKITDQNTTGLRGKKWDDLVYNEGTSNKDNLEAGGSYGIGKNAPYAASSMNLVCYSTRYLDRRRIEKYIARCKLIAHKLDSRKQLLQHIGFGTSHTKIQNDQYPPMLNSEIPKPFRLEEDGTGIFIVGFEKRAWKKHATKSITSNFFAAIHDRKLRVEIDGDELTHETLSQQDFTNDARQYYNLYKDTSIEIVSIEGKFGRFKLKVNTGDESMNNQVAYINKRGMLITDAKTRNKNPFSVRREFGKYTAVIWSDDNDTTARIREMEPPNHQSIEYARVDDDERDEVEKELAEINEKISQHIKKKLNDTTGGMTTLDEFNEIIPFTSDPHSDNLSNSNDSSTNTSTNIVVKRKNPRTEIPTMYGEEESGSGHTKNAEKNHGGGNNTTHETTGRQRQSSSHMKNSRVVRHGNKLRVAFQSKTGINRFRIEPLGEETKPEKPIQIDEAEQKSDTIKSLKIDDNVIWIETKTDARVILDVNLTQSSQYTSYILREYQILERRK